MSFEPRNILVAYKKSRWEHFVDETGSRAGEEKPDEEDESIGELKESHRIHRRGVEQVCQHLAAEDLEFESHYRGDVEQTDQYDLIVTVGGDGTVLDISHRVDDVPLLAINSHPDSSVGYFCAGTVDEFPTLLDEARAGDLPRHALTRFSVYRNSERLEPCVLNDILIAHANPAAVTRYDLQIGDRPAESQRSSGIWVSTPAGSTAAIRSAGGFVLPLGCRCLEYLVREPYPLPDTPYRYLKGVHPLENSLKITMQTQHGRIFVDGPHIAHELEFGDTVEIGADAPPLKIFGLHPDRRVR